MTQAQEQEFRRFLEGVIWQGRPLTAQAVVARIAKVKQAEDVLGVDIETIVATDVTMRLALMALRSDDAHGNRANAVRKYYEMRRGYEFPRIRDLV